MVAHRDIIFENRVPSVEEFIAKINEITGLTVVYNEDKGGEGEGSIGEIENPMDPRDSFYYSYGQNMIYLTVMGYPSINYLLGVGLYALVQLGGNFLVKDGKEYAKGYIPKWANLSWDQVKDEKNQLPTYLLPGNLEY